MVEDTSPKHQRPHLRHEQHQKPHLRQQHLLHQHRGLVGHHQLPLLIHKGTWMSLLVRLLPNSVRYWGFFEQTCLNKTFWRKWTCVHLFLYCWYSWWISSRLLSAVMCVFQSAGMGGWSSWSMRISSSPLCHGLDRCCVAHNRLGWSGKPFRGHIAVSLPMHPNIATFPSACLCCAPLPTAHGHVLYWSGLPRLSECAQSGWEAIGNPVLRRKSSFTFRCSWALYGHVIHFGHRGIISSNNAKAAISPTENCHYQAFYRL